MTKARKLIVGNWKMNGTRALAQKMADFLRVRVAAVPCEVLICPPALLIGELVQALAASRVMVGGQDCHANARGAHTGDIAAVQLRDAGCSHVIVGHCERRCDHGESNALVQAKAQAAIDAGLVAVLCLGETHSQRQAGETLGVVERQLQESIPQSACARTLVLAYEPVWAIGSSVTPTLEQIGQVHHHLRACLERLGPEKAAIRLLYGGSVKGASAGAILSLACVDGVLVGGASLEAEEFFAIIASCP